MVLFVVKDVDSLPLSELFKELDPERITRDLRWQADTDYQSKVAMRILGLLKADKDNLKHKPADVPVTSFYQRLIIGLLEGGKHKEAKVLCESIWQHLHPKGLSGDAQVGAQAGEEPEYYAFVFQTLEAAPEVSAKVQLDIYCKYGLAISARESKQFDKADQYFKEAFKFCRTLVLFNEKVGLAIQANLQRNKGISYLPRQLYEIASNCFRDGCADAEAAGVNNFKIPLLNYLALAKVREGEKRRENQDPSADEWIRDGVTCFEEAHRSYLAAHSEEELSAGCLDWASHLGHMGMAYEIQGDYPKAIESIKASYDIRQHLPAEQRDRFADVCKWLASVYEKHHDVDNAIQYYLQAADEYRVLPTPMEEKAAELDEKIAELRSKQLAVAQGGGDAPILAAPGARR